jgi:Pyruvate/2-oxoacid:ferredoxin oxidoreductase delta subunit
MAPEEYDHYGDVPKVPDKYATKKKKPKEIAVVNPGNCTGCEICVPFCPVNCIEQTPAHLDPDRPIPPVRIRYNECIGCTICVRVCNKLAWDAIDMKSVDFVEEAFGLKITEKFPPVPPAPPKAPAPAAPPATPA